jgi:succinyl-CoA synthetase beta subunit
MNIHEYQAKQLLAKYGVPTPRGIVANTPKQAVANAHELGGDIWVVKAQIHAGGRGLGGGVKLAKSIEEVEQLAGEILHMTLVTHQTGPEGKEVHKVYIEEGADIKDELYLGVVLDRAQEMPIIMASTEGGMEIEKVAEETPEKIIKVAVDPAVGFQGFHGRKLAFGLGITDKTEQKNIITFAKKLYTLYMENDAEMILDGEIGCMVNGAGLAMGTMDTINYMGGTPANFLDVGGKANAETVAKGFEIILKNKNVKAIFVNIFGGIVRCDRIANGILEATKLTDVHVPVIVRLDGTNAEEAAEILKNAGIKNVIAATDLADGAAKAVEAAKQA